MTFKHQDHYINGSYLPTAGGQQNEAESEKTITTPGVTTGNFTNLWKYQGNREITG